MAQTDAGAAPPSKGGSKAFHPSWAWATPPAALPSELLRLTGSLWALAQAALGIAGSYVHRGAAPGPRLRAVNEAEAEAVQGDAARHGRVCRPPCLLTSRRAGSRGTWPSLSPPEPWCWGPWLPTHWSPRPSPLPGRQPSGSPAHQTPSTWHLPEETRPESSAQMQPDTQQWRPHRAAGRVAEGQGLSLSMGPGRWGVGSPQDHTLQGADRAPSPPPSVPLPSLNAAPQVPTF